MSLVLAKIHYWLYDQIKTIEKREQKIIESFKEEYDVQEIDKIVKNIRAEYGQLKGDTPLEDLIGDSHIHSWLEEAITVAQTREATLVKQLIGKYDDKELLLRVYQQDGREVAAKSMPEQSISDLQGAFELLKNTLLDRMPCDQLSAVVHNEVDKIIWRHSIKLHTEFWDKAGVERELMHDLYQRWISGFIKRINSNIKHERKIMERRYEDIFTLEK